MNVILKIFIFFHCFNVFCCSCKCYNNIKYKQDNENNQDGKGVKPPVEKDKKDKDKDKDKDIMRRPSYFTWSNGNCIAQVFCLTFIMIFKDNPDGLKLLEDSNILFFQKVA